MNKIFEFIKENILGILSSILLFWGIYYISPIMFIIISTVMIISLICIFGYWHIQDYKLSKYEKSKKQFEIEYYNLIKEHTIEELDKFKTQLNNYPNGSIVYISKEAFKYLTYTTIYRNDFIYLKIDEDRRGLEHGLTKKSECITTINDLYE